MFLKICETRSFLHRFITFDDLSATLGNTTENEALETVWEESLLAINARLDRITLHDFKTLMKRRPKDNMTEFIQSVRDCRLYVSNIMNDALRPYICTM